MMWWDQGSGWTYGVMSLGMLAFLALVVWAIVAIGHTDSRRTDPGGSEGSGEASTAGAEKILAERFARGEIDADGYHHRLADLHPHHPTGTRP